MAVDLDQAERFFRWWIPIGIAIVIVSQVGEYLDWWDFWGEAGTIFGLTFSALGLLVAVLVGATKGQVKAVAIGVQLSNTKLDRLDSTVREGDRVIAEKLDHQTEVLVQIRDRLP